MRINKKFRKQCMYDESLKGLFEMNGLDSLKVGLALEKDCTAHLWTKDNESLRKFYFEEGITNIFMVGLDQQAQMESLDVVDSIASVATGGDSSTTGAATTVANLASNFLKSEIATFSDANQGEVAEAPTAAVSTDYENAELSEELKNFLKRPFRIAVYDYNASTVPWSVTELLPWSLYMTTNAILRKTANYSYFRGNLKLKFIVNCSPFYYGGLFVSYCPKNRFADQKRIHATETGAIFASQRQHILIEPQSNKGGEMTLPFFYEGKACPLATADQSSLGRLTITPLCALRSSNGTAAPTIQIRIFAWMEDCELFGSSRYAQADIISVAGSVASSNDKADLNSLTLNDNLYKGIGTSFYNSPNADECDMSYLIQKESLYLQLDIPMSKPPDQRIVAFVTEPYAHREYTNAAGTHAIPNPMGYVSQMFKYWRGNLIFRFKFLCTQFHKGRVRLTYDPVSGALPNYEDSIYRDSHIIDLEETQDFEFVVPFTSRTNWLNTRSMSDRVTQYTTSTGSVWNPNPTYDSGVIQLQLDNSLTAPGVSDPIVVLIYMRGADNLILSNPKALPDTLWMRAPSAAFAPAMGIVEEEQGDENDNVEQEHFVHAQMDTFEASRKVTNTEEVKEGHAPDISTSVLDICKRLVFFRTEAFRDSIPAENYSIYNTVSHNGVPWWRGVLDPLQDIVGGSNYRTAHFATYDNMVERVKLIPSVWMMGCYSAHVGSFTWFVKPIYSDIVPDYVAGSRSERGYRYYETQVAPTSQNNNFQDYNADIVYKNTLQGEALAGYFAQPYFKVSSPFYNFEKFYFCNTFSRDNGTIATEVGPLRGLSFQFRSGGKSEEVHYQLGGLEQHVAAGADWKLIYFISCPMIYLSPINIPMPTV